MTTVVHCKKEPYDVYIGRPSIYGNPFSVKDVTPKNAPVDARDVAISLFTGYAEERLKTDTAFRDAILALDGKILGCWCKPQACHGDVLVKMVEKIKMGVI